MTDETKQTQIELEESDLTSKSLKKFGYFAGIGVLASILFGVLTVFEIGPSWLKPIIIVFAVIAFLVTADTGLDRLSSAHDEEGDEWQKSVVNKARSDAFIVCSLFVFIALITLFVLDIFRGNMDLNMDLDDLIGLFLALSGVLLFLPKMILAGSIKPSDKPE